MRGRRGLRETVRLAGSLAVVAGMLAGCTGVDGTGNPYGMAYLPPPSSLPQGYYPPPSAYKPDGKPIGYALPDPAPQPVRRAVAPTQRAAAPAPPPPQQHTFGDPTAAPAAPAATARVSDHGFADR